MGVDVVRIAEGRIAEIITFGAHMFAPLGLPAAL